MTTASSSKRTPATHSRRWMSWLLGIAFLAGVVVIATHLSEELAFYRMVREVRFWWLAGALVLQAGTYIAQGEIWHSVGRMAGKPPLRSLLYRLSVAKIFVDQAIPSAGMSGTLVVAQALEDHALPRPAVLAGVVINTTSFFIAYIAALAVTLAALLESGHATSLIVSATLLFIVSTAALTVGILTLSGTHISWLPKWLDRYRIVRDARADARDADSSLVRNVNLQATASCYQALTFILDAATLWMLTRALGATVAFIPIFACFMIANLFRTVSFIPGGLGTFEAAVLYMMKSAGVPIGIGLAATLLFRGLTFFLPMIPGMWFSHRLEKPRT